MLDSAALSPLAALTEFIEPVFARLMRTEEGHIDSGCAPYVPLGVGLDDPSLPHRTRTVGHKINCLFSPV
jgi:hypothetical protein